jgi:nitrate reductase assembly molybdenum cofactor insertion protein NarJ
MAAKATRVAFGEAMLELAAKDPRIVVVNADLGKSTMTQKFAEVYPERSLNVGIAEANLIGIGAGLALSGEPNELPDHISLELEFNARCVEMEARNLRAGQQGSPEAAGWRLLRRRFLEQHVQAWVPRLCEEMERRASTAFYRAAARVVAGVLALEGDALPATDAPVDRVEPPGQETQDGRSRAPAPVE